MSYNIRNNASDGPNHWEHRKELWASTVRSFDPDLLGLQEVGMSLHDQVLAFFPDYQSFGTIQSDPHHGDSLILYRADRFEAIDAGSFWLSDTPDVVGSLSWDSNYVRACCWVKLRDRRNGRMILHGNTHLDHAGVMARAESAKLLRARLGQQAAGDAVVLTGDFNCTEFDEPYRRLLDSGSGLVLHDSYRRLHPRMTDQEATYHPFNGVTAGHRFDWILHTPALIPLTSEIVRDQGPDGRWPSDHFAVTTVFQ
jgi:endonuclease/exonuclease/phosphatase family metal-dependent hydrolase